MTLVLLGCVMTLALLGGVREVDASETSVVVDGDRLTVRVRDAPLADLLRLIADRTGVGVVAEGNLDVRVTAAFDDIAIEEALTRLAGGHATVRIIPRSSRATAETPSIPAAQPSLATLDIVGALSLRPGDPGRLTALDRLLTGSPDASVRARAATALATERDPQAIAALTRAVGDDVPTVRVHAIYALRQAAGPGAVGTLAKVLTAEKDPRVRAAAARALSFLPGDEAAAALARAREDPHPSVRREASRGSVPIESR